MTRKSTPKVICEHILQRLIITDSDYQTNPQEDSEARIKGDFLHAWDRSVIKTPHADLSIGIDLEALISALSLQDLNRTQATEFIAWLQNEMVQHELDEPLEPMLLLVPAERALNLAFPFAVVEGKVYSTNEQIIEAENQAEVSMACAHKMLYRLDRMANHGTLTIAQPRILFSVTTQDPIHKLYTHWTADEDDVRIFRSRLGDS